MSQNKNRLPNYEKKQSWANYDPVDASRTAANVEVAFLKRLFTFKLRTRNAFSLITMLLFGIALTGFMSFAIYAAITTFVHSHGAQVGPYLFLAFFYISKNADKKRYEEMIFLDKLQQAGTI